MSDTFTINFDGSVPLSVEEIWPDGDAPSNPTVDDVIARMRSTSSGLGSFLRDWNLEDDIDVSVEGNGLRL